MRLPVSLKNNLIFLLAEAQSQLANLQILLENPLSGLAGHMLKRRGYATNLRIRIHESSAEALRLYKKKPVDTLSIRAAEAVSINLERIIEGCFDSAEHVENMHSKSLLRKKTLTHMPQAVMEGLQQIEQSLDKNKATGVDDIRAIYDRLNKFHNAFYDKRIRQINRLKYPTDAIESLFIANQFVEMGKRVVNIAESIMSASIGQPLKLDGYLSLQSVLTDIEAEEVKITPLAQTRSGSEISGISDKSGDHLAVFKDGQRDKLNAEKNSVDYWQKIFPGLVPRILAFNKEGKKASLLIEYLPGKTFEHILLHESRGEFESALNRLLLVLRKIWKKTKNDKPVAAGYMLQLRKRLPAVFDIHSEFEHQRESVCGKKFRSLEQMIEDALRIEKKLDSSFSVLIHGDFNVDNIMYDNASDELRLIDLHRSERMDFVQDISVFMVSNYRLQVVDEQARRRIRFVCEKVYEHAEAFALKNKDDTFQIRLTLGLVRSLLTSTRFIMDRALAKNMYLRAVYLLEKLASAKPGKYCDYKISIRELFS